MEHVSYENLVLTQMLSTLNVVVCCITVIYKRHVFGCNCCMVLCESPPGLSGCWIWGAEAQFIEPFFVVLGVVPLVICLVLVPGKLLGSVAGRRRSMSNVLRIVWLFLKTKTRLSLRNSRPSKIFIAIKQSNCLWLGPCLLWTLIKAWDAAILQIARWTCGRDTCDPWESSLA